MVILDDLYKLDPELKALETELVPVIEALLQAKPDVVLDANFADQLKQRLLTNPKPLKSPTYMPTNFNKFAFLGLGGLITLVIAVPVTYKLSQSNSSLVDFSLSSLSSVPAIKSLNNEAFGSLAVNSISESAAVPLSAPSTRSSDASGMGGGGGVATLSVAELATDDKMMAPGYIMSYPGQITEYVYVYMGETLDLSNISDFVYRKNGGLDLGNLGHDLTRGNLGAVNLGRFRGLNVQTFSVKQPEKNGYSIHVDAENGQVSINGNEGLWGYSDGDYTPLTESDIMSNESLISVSDKFLYNYGIDTAGFGSPVVDDRSLVYALTQPADQRYIQEVMTVTYPLLLEGQPTYTSDGSAFGIYVNINLRNQAVTGVTLNLASSYDKSSYELERDADKILELASHGGLYYYPMEDATETIKIELSTPKLILMNHYTYNDSTSESLFIPALSFPITKNDETYPIYNNNVVIPLVKSVIENVDQGVLYKAL